MQRVRASAASHLPLTHCLDAPDWAASGTGLQRTATSPSVCATSWLHASQTDFTDDVSLRARGRASMSAAREASHAASCMHPGTEPSPSKRTR